VARFGGWISFGNEGMKEVSNQYAAMPSMHIGWSTWSALVLVPLLRRRWAKVRAGLYPVVTLTCILVTANHYWIDGVGGLVCLAAGYGLARLVTVRRGAATATAPTPACGAAWPTGVPGGTVEHLVDPSLHHRPGRPA
jgi:hypothetical protein